MSPSFHLCPNRWHPCRTVFVRISVLLVTVLMFMYNGDIVVVWRFAGLGCFWDIVFFGLQPSGVDSL